MTILLSILGEAAFFVGVFALHFLTILAFRNPFRPEWLNVQVSSIFAAIGMSVLIGVSCGLLISGLIDTGIGMPAALAFGTAFVLVAPIVLWRLMGMRARLDACDQGRSPFTSLGTPTGGSIGRGTLDPA